MPVDELRQASNRLARRVQWRNLREYAAVAVVVAVFSFYGYRFHAMMLRAGASLTIAGALFMAFQLYRKGSAAEMAAGLEAKNCLEFYRMELVRQRDLLATIWKWYLLPFAPGMILFLLGLLLSVMEQPAAHLHYGLIALVFGATFAVCAGVFVLVGAMNHRAAKELQRQIDALDAARIES